MRSRLAQERSVKLDAFQRVRELESQLHDTEQSSLQMGSPSGKRTLLWLEESPSLGGMSQSGAFLTPRLSTNPRPGSGLSMNVDRMNNIWIKPKPKPKELLL